MKPVYTLAAAALLSVLSGAAVADCAADLAQMRAGAARR